MKKDGTAVENGPLTLERALEILGPDKVLTVETVAKAWGKEAVANVPIRYTAATLIAAAKENQRRLTNWRLVYVYGESLRHLRELVGIDTNVQPCFWDNDWWFEQAEDYWAAKPPQGAYYLLDFRPRWGDLYWSVQEAELAELGDRFERADPAVFTEACLSIFKASGQREERIAKNWFHWSGVADSGGYFVNVGDFGTDGWSVYNDHRDLSKPDLRVVVFRKFDT